MHQIRYSPVLACLDDGSLGKLLSVARQVHVPAEQRVGVAGEPLTTVCLVVEGSVKLFCSEGGGRETLIGLATPGELIGGAEALEGTPATWDAVTATAAVLVHLDPATFSEVVGTSAPAACELVIEHAARVRSLARTLLERSDGDTHNKLAGRILDLSEVLGTMRAGAIELELPVSREELGQMAGISRESACRGLAMLHRSGTLRCERRRIRILDRERLQAVSCGAPVEGSSRSSTREANRLSRSS